jgi:heat shock protein HslJ
VAGSARFLDMRAWMRLLAFALLCCPSAARDANALMPMPLLDTVWSWHSTTAADGSRTPVASPEKYTLQLLRDGTARVRADCNRGGGAYRSNDVELRFDRIATTKRGCAAGSRGREFLAALGRVDSYRFEGIDLLAVAGGATLRFRPLAP